ncbi:TIGR02391 family protein [Gordonia sp. SMJS1]|uniref:TIGR02391 family protein n=1 Tax=Gordonia sp. SMJS1 TaxID=3039400 RepID=UPI00245383C9|nr:TIGR02391 family protein [Gordonia sp. SMJS1]WGJ88027.1 TIGR02391 family protein [Gordonia sp. SMJS1]
MNLDGVDTDWARERLEQFVDQTRPVNQSSSSGRVSYITNQSAPACGRPQAIELAEVVRPILDRLYPEWRVESQASKNDEFKLERDAARKLLARLASHDEVAERLGRGDASPRITAGSMHHLIWKAAEPQWSLGQRHEAVLAAAKAVNSLIQAKVGRRDLSDRKLVQEVFSPKQPEPGKPRLRFPEIIQDETRESMRQGAMDFGAGCFSAIRNPLGHLPNDELDLDEQTALEQLAALSLLARWVDQAEIERA